MTGRMQEKNHHQDPIIQAISWKAQHRLHKRYDKLIVQRGKQKCVAATAVARELLGFIWAIAVEIERRRQITV